MLLKFRFRYILYFILFILILLLVRYIFHRSLSSTFPGFKIYWNVRTHQCRNICLIDFVQLLRTYGILVNDGDKFQGESITIFYEDQLGLYPRILESGTMENGGIPQKGDLAKHLQKSSKDIESIIPSKEFNGLGIIDWESWRPTWERNWNSFKIYQTESLQLAKKLYPTLNATAIKSIAKFMWQTSSRAFMLETLNLAKKMRPNGRWCYYLFPDCYNHKGSKPSDFQCSTVVRERNDRLAWLWEASTAICPSIYLHPDKIDQTTFEERTWKDNEELREARRVVSRKSKIFAYINYSDKSSITHKRDTWRMLAQAAASGSDGAVIWGSTSSVESENQCKVLGEYIKSTLGPAAEMVAWNSNLCSKQICNAHGRCTWPNDNSAKAWRLFTDNTVHSFLAEDITCRCAETFGGRYCEHYEVLSDSGEG